MRLVLIVLLTSHFAWSNTWTNFETELAPETARHYQKLKARGQTVPLRWSDTNLILDRTPEILIRIGKMNSPLDRSLFLDGVPYTISYSDMSIDDNETQKLVAYLGDPELQPSRALEIFFDNTRKADKESNTSFRVALEIDRNMDRALNLLMIHELQNKEDSYVMRGLIARLRNEPYENLANTERLSLPGYFKLFLKYLSNAQRDTNGEKNFRYAIDMLSELPPELILLTFNRYNMPTSSLHAHYGYSDFNYKLAHVLKDAESVFKVTTLPAEKLLKVITPILRELEKSERESSFKNTKVSLRKEILAIATNALSLVDTTQNDFYTRSIRSYIARSSHRLESLQKQRDQQAEQTEIKSKQKPTLEEQMEKAKVILDKAFSKSFRSSDLIEIGNITISYKKINRHIEGQDLTIYTIPYLKPGMSSTHLASDLSWLLPEYQHGVFVLEQILNRNSEGWVLWDHNIPERIQSLPSLEVKPFGVKNMLLRLISVSCSGYFQ